MRSSESNDRKVKRARAGVVVAAGVLLAAVAIVDPGGRGLLVVAIAVGLFTGMLAVRWVLGSNPERDVDSTSSATASVESTEHLEPLEPLGHDTPSAPARNADTDVASAFVVSLARRNGGLVDQQLALLDTLEASVEDPVLLGNYFKLDHLATRMRRNADSLLVLAGIERPGLRVPQDIDEVVRAGISEIEDYRRIDVLALEHVEVTGLAATTLGHLIAELLDNATGFSPPEARVRIAGNSLTTGYEILIADSGIGISEARLEALNTKLALPPQYGADGESSIGLTVVSMLAARIGATVSLSGGAQGTVATVRIPTSVLHVDRPVEHAPALASRSVAEPALAFPAVSMDAVVAPAVTAPVTIPADTSSAVSLPSVAQLEAANAVAKLTQTVSGLPVRSAPAMPSDHVEPDRLGTGGPAAGAGTQDVGMHWPPPSAAAPKERAFAPPTALQTALGSLQVADSSEPRPVVEAHADRIGAAMASFARQREPLRESPLEAEPARS